MLTLELRWFVPGAITERELRAFASDGEVEVRTDSYLLDMGEELGVKRRGAAGLLEHKRRLARVPITVEHPGGALVGVAERWEKHWPDRDMPPSDRAWMEIAKRRALRRAGACRAELTLLGGEWLASEHLTLALETTRPDALDSLLRDTTALLRTHAWLATTFEHAESCGYPAFLQRARWESNPQPTG